MNLHNNVKNAGLVRQMGHTKNDDEIARTICKRFRDGSKFASHVESQPLGIQRTIVKLKKVLLSQVKG